MRKHTQKVDILPWHRIIVSKVDPFQIGGIIWLRNDTLLIGPPFIRLLVILITTTSTCQQTQVHKFMVSHHQPTLTVRLAQTLQLNLGFFFFFLKRSTLQVPKPISSDQPKWVNLENFLIGRACGIVYDVIVKINFFKETIKINKFL